MRSFESIARIGLTAAIVSMVACVGLPDQTGQATQDVVSTDLMAYMSGQDVVVTYSNMEGTPTDWISLAQTSDPDTTYEAWQYTDGGAAGTLTFAAPNLAAGTYEARAYYDWADTFSYTIAQRSAPFTISGGVMPSVTTDQTMYTSGQPVTATYSDMPGNDLDWVAIAAAGSPVTSYVAWDYTNGAINGSQAFDGLADGSYVARVYRDNTYDLLASSATFTISGATVCNPGQMPVLSGLTSGDLVISAAQQTNSVLLSVPIANSILFTSMAENEPSPDYGAVVCDLHADDVDLGSAGVTCLRNDLGTDQGSGVITIHFTVATFSSGVTVQSGMANTSGTDPQAIALSTIDPTSSFVILNGMVNGGTGWGANEFVQAQIADAQTLNISTGVAGTTTFWQVVSMTGASVQRGTASFGTADVEQQATISAAPTGSFALASYTTDNATGIASAALMMQTTFANSTTLDFKRSLGGSNLNVAWEVVSLPYATQLGVTSFGAGSATETDSVPGIDPTSSVALGSTESILGESGGSTTYNGAEGDLVGEAAATLTTTSNGVIVTRGTSQASATIPWTVIDFSRDCAGN